MRSLLRALSLTFAQALVLPPGTASGRLSTSGHEHRTTAVRIRSDFVDHELLWIMPRENGDVGTPRMYTNQEAALRTDSGETE